MQNMMTRDGWKRYNVVAAFADKDAAQRAVRTLADEGLQGDVRLMPREAYEADERAAEKRAEMQREVDESFAGPSISMFTKAQAQGAFWGTLLLTVAGAAVGLVIGGLWVWLGGPGMSAWARLGIPVVVFAIGGATAGFVAGGALKPRMESERDPERPMDDQRFIAEMDTLVAVHTDDRPTLARAQKVLVRTGAEDINLVNEDGMPLPPQHERPRPADTEERWWWSRQREE